MAAFSQDFDATFNDGVSTWGMEAVTVTLGATTSDPSFKQINFRQTYDTAPIVVVLATDETSDPAAIIIKDVTTTGFKAVQAEPANNDGTQGAMTVHYLAIEPGTHELPDGTRILADVVSTTAQQHGTGVSGSESWQSVTFASWPGVSGSPLPESQVFTYDANGNRTTITEDSIPYTYSNMASSNRLLSTTGPTAKTYSHDASGNVTGDGTYTFGYDDRGRLVTVDSGTTATYAHNGQGQRVKKDDGSTETLYVYDEAGQLIGEYDDTGTAILEHVWFSGAPVAVIEGTNHYYVHTDHLGTPRIITDGNTDIWRWESGPFGEESPDEDPDGDSTDFTYNLRFPGQYYDVETGLHYNYFRTYDPSTGRYLESDPIGLKGGLNTYGYVSGNPASYIDPLGLLCVSGVGCYTTQAELDLARQGKYLEYWQLACANGDAHACFAEHVAANDSWWGNRANNRLLDNLRDRAEDAQQCIDEAGLLEDIRADIAKRYAEYLPQSKDDARWPNESDIAELHWQAFGRFGLPPSTFGGSPFGSNGPILLENIWCPNCQ